MVKKKAVFLFGAGAALPWNAPKTSELTEIVLFSGFTIKNNKTTITRFIYDRLIEKGHDKNDITFETIINVIEELIVYYSHFNNKKKTTSLLSCFFTPDCEKELLNFSVEGGTPTHNYRLQIPEGSNYDFSNFSQHSETPAQFFFQHLIAVILTDINIKIEEYANHCLNASSINKTSSVSQSFISWMKSLSKQNILRMYTLNYDRLFKILLEGEGISVFEGFDCGEFIGYNETLRANVCKILSDFDINVHFNLHGSSFWKVHALDSEQLPNPEFFLNSNVVLPINDDFALFQIEKGKTLMLTNIITGYQKGQKTLLTPFKQMQSVFDSDCCFAADIFIIGYSLCDEHINESIKTAIRHSKNVKITIIDPYFIKNQTDYESILKIFPFKDNAFATLKPKTVRKNLHTFFDGAVTAHTIGFEEFLNMQQNPFQKDHTGQYL